MHSRSLTIDPRFSTMPGRHTSGIVVVLTLTRIIKSVVTGQAPVTLELRNTPGKKHTQQPKVLRA